ncbi:winged helix-turn-helix domain-containing protein [Rhizobium cauense]|uniref:winged helix-turn-helix domain-containing protein n=1 Tax=Rhizobium cauense TaxID=1166683 RepID=UPI001C6E34F6|nr:winged helix-turn-helix domain-containing protein [Rhizobium cauense]MBW9116914.1 winged helix-turn-helix domain-containing protein [Rhizobium cauense]
MAVIKFGTFELDILNKKLTETGRPYQLGKKALELLIALVSKAGEIVSKDELLRAGWPTTTVDEGALRVHLVTLRKALGEHSDQRYIENIPGRGYMFVAPTELSLSASITPMSNAALDTNLPRFASRLIGREDFIQTTLAALASTRLLTIVGAGGIGKTAVALETAMRIQSSKRVIFLDLAVLNDGNLLMPTLASSLGLVLYTSDYRQAVLNSLEGNDILLLFDNCEHLIDAVALEVDQILRATASVSILTTSREPLLVAGEKVRQLPSLPVPDLEISCQDLLSIPSVELFVEAVKLASDIEDFADEESLRAAAAIVRSLDGIPLAIELAASRVSSLGLKSVLGSLDDPLSILRRGRRTAPPRQQTLRATLDWSYNSLSDDEKELFAMIAVFPGTFSDQGAETIADVWLSGERFDRAFDGLLLKSLIAVSSADGRYRLLDTTKGYAAEKLADSTLDKNYRLSHAHYCRDELLRAEYDWRSLTTGDWMRRYGSLINDLRAAAEWARSSDGDFDLAVELVAISNVIWVQSGAMSEQSIAIERALKLLPSTGHVGTDIEVQLRIARGSALYHTRGFKSDDEAIAEFERAIALAERLGNPARIMRAFGGKASVASSNGRYHDSIAIAKDLQARFPGALSFSRLLEHNYLFHGDLSASRQQAEISIMEASRAVRTTQNYGTGYDQGTIARSVVSMIDFLEGKIDRSLEGIRGLLADSEILGHSISTCLMLTLSAVPIAYLAGDTTAARSRLNDVRRIATKDMLVRWREWVDGYELIIPQETQTDEVQSQLQRALLEGVGMRLEYMTILAGCRASPAALDRALSGNAGWCRPELLRLKAVSLIKQDRVTALQFLNEGLQLARSMGAIFWELRCALCLFRLAPPNDVLAARRKLESVLAKFVCSDPIADVEMALALLDR